MRVYIIPGHALFSSEMAATISPKRVTNNTTTINYLIESATMPVLGPIPETLREQIEWWINDAQHSNPHWINKDGSLSIGGGPARCYSIHPNGDVLAYDPFDDCTKIIEDGPHKISVIIVAAQHRPEFQSWLPMRPLHSCDCPQCDSAGWLTIVPIKHQIVCSNCSGLGWIANTENPA